MQVQPENVELVRRDYVANGGWETFLAYEDPEQDILVSCLACSPAPAGSDPDSGAIPVSCQPSELAVSSHAACPGCSSPMPAWPACAALQLFVPQPCCLWPGGVHHPEALYQGRLARISHRC